jgi:predicted nuclease of predicted toxin-antitoxin system
MADDYEFLIDVNLPKYFKFFRGENFEHQLDVNPSAGDDEIWAYAKANQKVIVTKDTDFFYRCQANPVVKVIHLQLGNTSLAELHEFFSESWDQVVKLL